MGHNDIDSGNYNIEVRPAVNYTPTPHTHEEEERFIRLGEARDELPFGPLDTQNGGKPYHSLTCTYTVAIKRTHPDAVIPFKARPGDAGFDLVSVEDAQIEPGETKGIDTGWSCAMDGALELQIRPRSGLAVKNGLTVLNAPGTIDSGYRGTIKVLLHNTSRMTQILPKGSKIAQGVFNWLPTIVLEEVEELPDSVRGAGGFGSSGK